MKLCKMCDKNTVEGKHLFCESCKTIRNKEAFRKSKRKRREKQKAKLKKELDENFKNLSLEGLDLLPNNFNKKSMHSYQAYRNHYDKPTWLEILDIYGKKESLVETLLEEFKKFYEATNSQDLKLFAKQIGTSDSFFANLDHSMFRDYIGVRKLRNSISDYGENFNRVTDKVGDIPLYSDFLKHTTISLGTYAERFHLKEQVYDHIVKMYTTEEEYRDYKIRQKQHKSKVGKENHQGRKYADKELEIEFKRVFDYYIEKIGKNPSKRIFNNFSKFDDSVYRKRLNMTFGEVIEYYGYNFDPSNNKSERLVVELIGSILGESPIPQASFDWLKSNKNYRLRVDAYYPMNSLIVEFDGKQHYEPIKAWGGKDTFKSIQENDNIKNSEIPKQGIKLVRISCYDPFWDVEFLRFRLIEHGIDVPNYSIVSSHQKQLITI